MTKDELVELIYSAFPCSSQIRRLSTADEAIRFNWRGNIFRVTTDIDVETVDDHFLVTSDIAILAEALLKRQYLELAARNEREKAVAK